MGDHRIIFEHDGEGDGPPSRPAWWAIALGLVAVAATVLWSGWSTTHGPATTGVSVPTVEVPSTLPPARIVAHTLRWEAPTGLEQATHLGGVVTFQGEYWLLGRTEAGLAAWKTADPAGEWSLAGMIEDGEPGWLVEDVAVVGDSLVVAASGWERNGDGGAIYRSRDGRDWRRFDLESGDPHLPTAVAEEVIALGDGVVLAGHAHPTRPPRAHLSRLVPQVRRLVRRGKAYLHAVEDETRVLLPPGISLARLPQAGDGHRPAPGEGHPFLWWGADLSRLRADSRTGQPTPRAAIRLDSGHLVGQTGDRLAFSADGRTWKPTGPTFPTDSGFTPWREGFVLSAGAEGPAYWVEGHDRLTALLPAGMEETPVPVSTVVESGDWGLAVARQPRRFFTGPGAVLVAETVRGDLYLPNPLTVELRRDGETVWSRGIGEGEVAVEEDGRLRFGTGPESVVVSVDQWLEALYFLSGNGRPSDASALLHTVDGREWSSTDWETISGQGTVARLDLFATDHFLVVADQATYPDVRLNAVAIGLPPDGPPPGENR